MDSAIKNEKLDLTILYVEDEPEVCNMITMLLEQTVSLVHVANNGRDGLAAYREHRPDIVITDIMMPVMDGLSMVRKIKQLDPNAVTVITTAINETDVLIEAIELGVNHFLIKPVEMSRFLDLLGELTEFISVKRQLRIKGKLLDQINRAVENSTIVNKMDHEGHITYVNNRMIRVSGYHVDELVGAPHEMFKHPDMPDHVYNGMWQTLKKGEIWKGMVRNISRDKKDFYLDMTVTPFHDEQGRLIEYVTLSHDVTELIEKKELIFRLYTDELTGMPNRMRLLSDIQEWLHPVLAIINVDKFETINNYYGHDIGDQILKMMSEVIQDFAESTGAEAYKLPADEFALLVNDENGPDRCCELIKQLHNRIMNRSFMCRGHDIGVHLTSGISNHHEALLETAGMTLKLAKRTRQRMLIYRDTLELTNKYKNNLQWGSKLRAAIADDRIVPFFQPIYNNRTNVIEKYESLVRLIDTDGSVVSPAFFLDIARQSRQYALLTQAVVDKTFKVMEKYPYSFSINLFISDILDAETTSYIKDKLRSTGFGDRLVIELLESEGIADYNEVDDFIANLKSFGCKFAIDDFGSGYSNFAHVAKLHIDYIKLDGSLIREIVDSGIYRKIVSGIISMANEMGFSTIAEFVSSKTIQEMLIELNVDFSQGYYIGKPIPEDQLN